MKTFPILLGVIALAVTSIALPAQVPAYLLDGNESSHVVQVLEGQASQAARQQMQQGTRALISMGQKDDPNTGKRWEKRRHIARVEASAPDGSVMQVVLGPAHWVEVFASAPSVGRVNSGYAWLEHHRNASYEWQKHQQSIVKAINDWRAWSQSTRQPVPAATWQNLHSQLNAANAWIQWHNAQASKFEKMLRSATHQAPAQPAPATPNSSGHTALGGIV